MSEEKNIKGKANGKLWINTGIHSVTPGGGKHSRSDTFLTFSSQISG